MIYVIVFTFNHMIRLKSIWRYRFLPSVYGCYNLPSLFGRDGRVVEGAGLENQYGSNLIVGSNPTLSAGRRK